MKTKSMVVASLVGIGMVLTACEIINENNSGFGLLSKNGTVPADSVSFEGGKVVNTWNNDGQVPKRATVGFVLDTSGSMADERLALTQNGLDAIITRLSPTFDELCFFVAGAYVPEHPTVDDSFDIVSYDGIQYDDLSGRMVPPPDTPEAKDDACVCISEYSNVQGAVDQVVDNMQGLGGQALGNGEAPEYALTQFFDPTKLAFAQSGGECFKDNQVFWGITMTDEQPAVMAARDGNDLNGNPINFSVDPDPVVDREDGNGAFEVEASKLFGSTLISGNDYERFFTVDYVVDIFQNFSGNYPFFYTTVTYPDKPSDGWSSTEGINTESPKIADAFSGGKPEYIVDLELAQSGNESQLADAFEEAAGQFEQDASYLTQFNTSEQYCSGSLVVTVDGVDVTDQVVEISSTKFRINQPFNQGILVEARFDQAGDC